MKETLKRSARTFLQAAVGYIAANCVFYAENDFSNWDMMKTFYMGLGVSAIAAGLAAVMNLPKGDNNHDDVESR